jgi:Family of unknown function (DUF5759)
MFSKNLSLNELYQVRQMKDHSKKASYERVLELAHRRIRNVNSYGGLNTFYEIPGMLVGFPLFNVMDCMNYVIEHLRGAGFLVQILPAPHIGVVYISWDPSELNQRSGKKIKNDGVGGGGGGGGGNQRLLPMEPKKQLRLNNGKYF